jgi:uncharacterized membrane-anchored protein YitT (DUF2179 family)
MKLKPICCLIAFLSSAFQAFGIYNVHALSGVTEGGTIGLVLLINHWTGISPAISGFFLNGACYLLGWRTLGNKFVAYSMIAAVGFSLTYAVCELFPPLWPELVNYPLGAALFGAIFVGLGSGFCVLAGGATSGDDSLAMSLSRILKMPIERIYYISDLTVLALSLTYIPFSRIAYSVLSVLLSSRIIGWIQLIPAKKRLE